MRSRSLISSIFALTIASTAVAQDYEFNSQYEGANIFSLLAGNDPRGVVLNAGDTFRWAILAQSGHAWQVNTSRVYGLLMSFAVNECAIRTGNYTVELFFNSSRVHTESATNVQQSCVHVGAQTTTLAAGLTFDRMVVSYELLGAFSSTTGLPTTSTLRSTLGPIIGAPERAYSSDIGYSPVTATPEPATIALTLSGLGMVGAWRRRRARSHSDS